MPLGGGLSNRRRDEGILLTLMRSKNVEGEKFRQKYSQISGMFAKMGDTVAWLPPPATETDVFWNPRNWNITSSYLNLKGDRTTLLHGCLSVPPGRFLAGDQQTTAQAAVVARPPHCAACDAGRLPSP